MSQPRYLTDESGTRVAVLLNISEYERLQTILKRLESLPLAVRTMLTAPEDDEPYTDEEREAVERARASVRAGRVLTHEEAKQRLLG